MHFLQDNIRHHVFTRCLTASGRSANGRTTTSPRQQTPQEESSTNSIETENSIPTFGITYATTNSFHARPFQSR